MKKLLSLMIALLLVVALPGFALASQSVFTTLSRLNSYSPLILETYLLEPTYFEASAIFPDPSVMCDYYTVFFDKETFATKQIVVSLTNPDGAVMDKMSEAATMGVMSVECSAYEVELYQRLAGTKGASALADNPIKDSLDIFLDLMEKVQKQSDASVETSKASYSVSTYSGLIDMVIDLK